MLGYNDIIDNQRGIKMSLLNGVVHSTNLLEAGLVPDSLDMYEVDLCGDGVIVDSEVGLQIVEQLRRGGYKDDGEGFLRLSLGAEDGICYGVTPEDEYCFWLFDHS